MSCQTVREQFDHRLDGRLSGHEQAAFEVHLAGCADCRREWEAYASAWQVLARDEGIEPSFGFAERTLRRLNEGLDAADEPGAAAPTHPSAPVARHRPRRAPSALAAPRRPRSRPNRAPPSSARRREGSPR